MDPQRLGDVRPVNDQQAGDAAMATIHVKRAYDNPEPSDGMRVLIDRLWPRGVKKADAKIDLWLKEIAPSSELRKWFDHDPAKWTEFKKRYFKELDARRDVLHDLLEQAKGKTLTLVFAAHDVEHNNAVALKQYLARLK